MFKKLLLTAIIVSFSIALFAQQEPEKKPAPPVKHEYVGAKMCNMCHKKGGIEDSWKAGPHAAAFEVLNRAQRKDENCLKCHTTGKTSTGHLLRGVQCEACHGPGSDYKNLKIMKNRDLAIANGLNPVNEMTCRKCHLDVLPEACKLTEKFDYKKMLAKGIHRMPSQNRPK